MNPIVKGVNTSSAVSVACSAHGHVQGRVQSVSLCVWCRDERKSAQTLAPSSALLPYTGYTPVKKPRFYTVHSQRGRRGLCGFRVTCWGGRVSRLLALIQPSFAAPFSSRLRLRSAPPAIHILPQPQPPPACFVPIKRNRVTMNVCIIQGVFKRVCVCVWRGMIVSI